MDLTEIADRLVARAKAEGAGAADAVVVSSIGVGASVRLGRLEDIERSENRDVGLRVLIGKRQAIASSTDWSSAALEQLVERVVAMAKAAPEDPYCGLADPALLQRAAPDLDLADRSEAAPEDLVERAKAVEAAGLAIPGVTNSIGGSAGQGESAIALVTSEGFSGSYRSTYHQISCTVLAGSGTAMERDSQYHTTRHLTDLESAELVGKTAGERAVARLNPRKIKTQAIPVIFERRVSSTLLGHFAGAINGASVARGTSFLKDKLGETIFRDWVTIIDDPHRRRGLASKPFDAEGVVTRRHALIDKGRLTTWLLDSASARQLGMTTTGHASRGTSSPPSPSTSNLHLDPGSRSLDAMIKDIGAGLLITDLIGFGVNMVTGDYSRGCSGYWIEKGELAYPVSEITVAGNLLDMFARLEPANDLEFRGGTNAPSLLIDGLTVAGN